MKVSTSTAPCTIISHDQVHKPVAYTTPNKHGTPKFKPVMKDSTNLMPLNEPLPCVQITANGFDCSVFNT